MGRLNKRQLQARRLQQSNSTRREGRHDDESDASGHDSDTSKHDENDPTPLQDASNRLKTRTRTSAVLELAAKDTEITSLRATISELRNQLHVKDEEIELQKEEIEEWKESSAALAVDKRQLQSQKRKLETGQGDEEARLKKRVKRLESDRDKASEQTKKITEDYDQKIAHLQATAQSHAAHITQLETKTRVRRNDTEAFIKKRCDVGVRKFVRAEVRRGGKTKRKQEFFALWGKYQVQKAKEGRERRRKSEARKSAKAAKLAAIVLEMDLAVIERMNSEQLREQLQHYRDVLHDQILLAKKWQDEDMRLVKGRRELVKAARLRELERRAKMHGSEEFGRNMATPTVENGEDCEMEGDDADWIDISPN
uniref:Uncharacterized protein n=1 Tax=Mycena chlorophos TaxID=658473 RepID=A0ABQ0L8U5_MYCCL|nr:predicted protein [Mycena chlorophos]